MSLLLNGGTLFNILNLIPFQPYNANLSPHRSTPEHRWNPWIPLLVRQQVPKLYPLWSLYLIQLPLLQMTMWISTLKGSPPSLRAVPLLPAPWLKSRRSEWAVGCCRRQPRLPVKFSAARSDTRLVPCLNLGQLLPEPSLTQFFTYHQNPTLSPLWA